MRDIGRFIVVGLALILLALFLALVVTPAFAQVQPPVWSDSVDYDGTPCSASTDGRVYVIGTGAKKGEHRCCPSGGGTWAKCDVGAGGGGGTPGGAYNQLQRNAAGSFGGVSGVVSNGTVLVIDVNGDGTITDTDGTLNCPGTSKICTEDDTTGGVGGGPALYLCAIGYLAQTYCLKLDPDNFSAAITDSAGALATLYVNELAMPDSALLNGVSLQLKDIDGTPHYFTISAPSLTAARAIHIPDASGDLVLTGGNQTIGGVKIFSNVGSLAIDGLATLDADGTALTIDKSLRFPSGQTGAKGLAWKNDVSQVFPLDMIHLQAVQYEDTGCDGDKDGTTDVHTVVSIYNNVVEGGDTTLDATKARWGEQWEFGWCSGNVPRYERSLNFLNRTNTDYTQHAFRTEDITINDYWFTKAPPTANYVWRTAPDSDGDGTWDDDIDTNYTLQLATNGKIKMGHDPLSAAPSAQLQIEGDGNIRLRGNATDGSSGGGIAFSGPSLGFTYYTWLWSRDPTATRSIFLPNAGGDIQVTGNSDHVGTYMWGDCDDTADTGTEVCALAGLTCVDVLTQAGANPASHTCSDDQGTVGTCAGAQYFQALCR